MTSFLLIPIYEPTAKTIAFFHSLTRHVTTPIIIVNDGSNPQYDDTFQTIKQMSPAIHYLSYPTNQGKGYALRYGMRYIQKQFLVTSGVVTADGDGQHSVPDIVKLLAMAETLPTNELLLGVRTFAKETTPKKSYYGNRITSHFFFLASGIKLADTQTGLRAFSSQLIPDLLAIKGNRFEYEMNVLLALRPMKIALKMEEIETIYEDNNEQTHFRPMQDSLLIYRPLLAFFVSSIASSVVDVTCFMLLVLFLGSSASELLAVTVGARILSGIVNYALNKRYVFQDSDHIERSGWKYAALFVLQLFLSWIGVASLSQILPSIFLTKLLVDCCLFFFSYHIQQRFIFNQQKKGDSHASFLS